MVPESIRRWLAFNPVVFYLETMRYSLLDAGHPHWGAMVLTSSLALLVGYAVFRRLAPHFEDFL
jgi:ABC-type polysaccharide/polyol phosphate export permease